MMGELTNERIKEYERLKANIQGKPDNMLKAILETLAAEGKSGSPEYQLINDELKRRKDAKDADPNGILKAFNQKDMPRYVPDSAMLRVASEINKAFDATKICPEEATDDDTRKHGKN